MQSLPSAVIAQLRADTHITDFTTAVWELVANAVDAGARTISLDVDPRQGYARVEDDGSGISYSSLQLLGTRSCTSKTPPSNTSSLAATYGTRGESLANLRLVSQLRVTSRAAQQFDTYTLALPPIRPNTSPPAAAPQPCAPRPHHGTTMIMQGFLLQQPVRQRLQQQDTGAALTSLVHHMGLRMAGQQQVDFRLTTAAGRQQLLHLQAGRSVADVCHTLCASLGDALQCISPSTPSSSSNSNHSYSMCGYITRLDAPLPNSALQVTYLNQQLVASPQISSFLAAWLQQHLAQQPPGAATLVARSARKPQPGYLLLLQGPRDGVAVQRQAAGSMEVVWQDWPAVCQVLANALAPLWGKPPGSLCPPIKVHHGSSRSTLTSGQHMAVPHSNAGGPSKHTCGGHGWLLASTPIADLRSLEAAGISGAALQGCGGLGPYNGAAAGVGGGGSGGGSGGRWGMALPQLGVTSRTRSLQARAAAAAAAGHSDGGEGSRGGGGGSGRRGDGGGSDGSGGTARRSTDPQPCHVSSTHTMQPQGRQLLQGVSLADCPSQYQPLSQHAAATGMDCLEQQVETGTAPDPDSASLWGGSGRILDHEQDASLVPSMAAAAAVDCSDTGTTWLLASSSHRAHKNQRQLASMEAAALLPSPSGPDQFQQWQPPGAVPQAICWDGDLGSSGTEPDKGAAQEQLHGGLGLEAPAGAAGVWLQGDVEGDAELQPDAPEHHHSRYHHNHHQQQQEPHQTVLGCSTDGRAPKSTSNRWQEQWLDEPVTGLVPDRQHFQQQQKGGGEEGSMWLVHELLTEDEAALLALQQQLHSRRRCSQQVEQQQEIEEDPWRRQQHHNHTQQQQQQQQQQLHHRRNQRRQQEEGEGEAWEVPQQMQQRLEPSPLMGIISPTSMQLDLSFSGAPLPQQYQQLQGTHLPDLPVEDGWCWCPQRQQQQQEDEEQQQRQDVLGGPAFEEPVLLDSPPTCVGRPRPMRRPWRAAGSTWLQDYTPGLSEQQDLRILSAAAAAGRVDASGAGWQEAAGGLPGMAGLPVSNSPCSSCSSVAGVDRSQAAHAAGGDSTDCRARGDAGGDPVAATAGPAAAAGAATAAEGGTPPAAMNGTDFADATHQQQHPQQQLQQGLKEPPHRLAPFPDRLICSAPPVAKRPRRPAAVWLRQQQEQLQEQEQPFGSYNASMPGAARLHQQQQEQQRLYAQGPSALPRQHTNCSSQARRRAVSGGAAELHTSGTAAAAAAAAHGPQLAQLQRFSTPGAGTAAGGVVLTLPPVPAQPAAAGGGGGVGEGAAVGGVGGAGAGGNNSRALRDLTNTWAASSGRDQAAPHSKAQQHHASGSSCSKVQQQQQKQQKQLQQQKQHDPSFLGPEGGLDILALQHLVGSSADEASARTPLSPLRHQEDVGAAEAQPQQLQVTTTTQQPVQKAEQPQQPQHEATQTLEQQQEPSQAAHGQVTSTPAEATAGLPCRSSSSGLLAGYPAQPAPRVLAGSSGATCEDPSPAGSSSSSGTAVPAKCAVAGAAPAGAATSSMGAGSKAQGTGSSTAAAPSTLGAAGSEYRGGSHPRRGSGGLKRKQTDAQRGPAEPGGPGSSGPKVRKQVRFADLPEAPAPAAGGPVVTCLQLPPSAAAAAAAQSAAAGGGQGGGASTVGGAMGVGGEEHQQEGEQTRQHGQQHPPAQQQQQGQQPKPLMPLKKGQPPAAAGADDRPLQSPAAAGLAAAQVCHAPGATTTSSSDVWVKQEQPILSLEELLTSSQQQQQQPTHRRSGSSAWGAVSSWAGQQQQGLAASGAGGGLVREVLEEGHLVTQVDSKLLLVAHGSRLWLVDQHAADERVQLEALQQHLAADLARALVQGGEAGQQQQQQQQEKARLLQSVVPDGSLTVQLTALEAAAAARYQQQLSRLGWQLRNSSEAASRNQLAASTSSSAGRGVGEKAGAVMALGGGTHQLVRVPCVAGVLLTGVDLQMYLHQLMETGVASTPPPGVLRVLRSKACRTAIMFGQRLSQQQGRRLLRQLSDTQLFWCCAHGRPTAVPLVDLHQVQAGQAAARRRAQAT